MSTTPNLLISHVSPSQNNKEVTLNTGLDDFDGVITDLLSIAMTAADYVMTTSAGGEALGHLAYKLSGSIGANRNLIVPAVKKLYVVSNQTTGGFTVTVKTPSGTGIAVSDTNYHILYCDGTNVLSLAAGGSGATSFTGLSDVPGSYSGAGGEAVEVNSGATALVFSAKPYVVGGFVPGTYTSSQVLLAVPVDRTVNFAAAFANSQATLSAAATASTVFLVKKNHSGTVTQIGTITFASSGTVGTFASTSGLAQSLVAGDILELIAPSSVDATAAGLGFALQGTR